MTATAAFSLQTGPTIDLMEMLTAKELRVQRQQAALTHYQSPVISLTLVIPGQHKLSPGAAHLFKPALQAINALIQAQQWACLSQCTYESNAGYEALWVIHAPAEEIKKVCLQLEEQHPLGRYWDIDVICPTRGILSRTHYDNHPMRRCLLCDEPAHACSRSRKHNLNDLLVKIEQDIAHFTGI